MFNFKKKHQPKVVMTKTLVATVEQILEDAREGESTSMDSALARPFKVLMEKGRDIGRINHLFYTHKGHSFILGTLCFSAGKRLIFFPGILERKVSWDTSTSKIVNPGLLDHITLEKDFKSWHLTIYQDSKKVKSSQLPSRNATNVEKDLDYWFGMSIKAPALLEEAVRKHIFTFNIPSEKIKHYSKIILESKRGAIFHNLIAPGEDLGNGEFLHFDFLIDRRLFRRCRNLPHTLTAVPKGPPALLEEIPNPEGFPIRAYQIRLRTFKGDILVLVSKHQGKLADNVVLSSAPEEIVRGEKRAVRVK